MTAALDILDELISSTEDYKSLPETIKYLQDYHELLEEMQRTANNAALVVEIEELRKHIVWLREQGGESFEDVEAEKDYPTTEGKTPMEVRADD